MRMKTRMKKPAKSHAWASSKRLTQFKRTMRTMSTRTMFIAVFGILGAAVFIGAATSNVRSDQAAAHAAAKTSAPAPAAPVAAESATAAAAPAPEAPAPEPVAAQTVKASPVTITGCLERNDEGFRLKDTAGDNAPRTRSWKSGFLKKGSAPVDIVDTSNKAKLPAHVGQRVSVTGVLVDREMQARSVQRVASSCSAKS